MKSSGSKINNAKPWIGILPAMLLPGIASLFYFVLIPESLGARIIYSATKVFTLIWPVMFFFVRPIPNLRALKASWTSTRVDWLLGICFGLLMASGMILVYLSPAGQPVALAADRIRQKAATLGMLDYYIPAALLMSLIHSAVEEYYWRWFVFGGLRTLVPSALAHLLAGAAFSLHHIVVTLIFFPGMTGLVFGLSVGAAGMIWSLMYERRGSLVSPWLAHVICDLVIFGIGYRILIN